MTFSYHERILYTEREAEVIPIRTELSPDDYKKAQEFIKRMKPLLATGDIKVIPRWKNKELQEKYRLSHKEQCDILKMLSAEDCVEISPNDNPRYDISAEVYKFFKDAELLYFGEPELVKLYLKLYIETRTAYDIVMVISFHEKGKYDQ